MEVVETRIDTVNFFIKDVEKDINNGVYIAGFRTLLGFSQYVFSNGTFIDSIDERFKESFLNGTIDKIPLSLMKDSTFTDWANKISEQADKADIEFEFNVNDVKLNHSDPWTVEIMLDISLNIKDKRNTSSWVRNKNLVSEISVVGFEDPLYVVNSNGRITNTITRSNFTYFVVGGDVTNLILHMNKSYYIATNESPSFLMRLQGDLGNSTYGIESLVNLDRFQQQGIAIKDRSIVDHVYFGTGSTTNYRINNTPEWFKLDEGHLDIYQARNVTI